jgi:hypothetical protein
MVAWLSLVVVAGMSITFVPWATVMGFKPGGGGAEQEALYHDSFGRLVVPLRLRVWGGGGPIQGRYTGVALRVSVAGESKVRSIFGKVATAGDDWELYEFLVDQSISTSNVSSYSFELTLDRQATTIAGKYHLSSAPP